HDARLVFDVSKEKEANPEDYVLVASTNANGPDSDDAQTPGEGDENETPGEGDENETPGEDDENETPGKDDENETTGEGNENETPGKDEEDELKSDEDPVKDAPTKGEGLTAEKVTEVPYRVLQADNDKESETNKRLSGKAIVLEYEGDTYVQIET